MPTMIDQTLFFDRMKQIGVLPLLHAWDTEPSPHNSATSWSSDHVHFISSIHRYMAYQTLQTGSNWVFFQRPQPKPCTAAYSKNSNS